MTTHDAVRPFDTFVILTTVPIGSVGCAHSPARYSYQLAAPSWLLLDTGAGAGADVVGGAAVVAGATFTTGFGAAVVGVVRATVTGGVVVGGHVGGTVEGQVSGTVEEVAGAPAAAAAVATCDELAPAAVRGMLSSTRIGNASTVSQAAIANLRRGTT